MQSACSGVVRNRKNDAVPVRIRLATGIFLQGSKQSDAQMVLVCPDGNVPLNSVAASILGLCDGSRDRAQLVTEVLRRTNNRARSAEIVEFLDAAFARGWITDA